MNLIEDNKQMVWTANQSGDKISDATRRLYNYLVEAHWNGRALTGPDPGIRFNTRVGRFVKSYLKGLPWSDNLIYMQAQGYWVFANWQIFDLDRDVQAKSRALSCSDTIVEMQQNDGSWAYPNPEWKGRIATVEGCFAALGLLESYSRIRDGKYLDAALRWFDFLMTEIGFRQQKQENMLAVNYFAHNTGDGGGVPNNSTLLIWLLARLSQLTGEQKYLAPVEKIIAWLQFVQLPSGELPYQLGPTSDKDTTHFLCFQYNAFEFMDLVHYYRITGDESSWPIIQRMAKYLSTGLLANGQARFDCQHESPDVAYYTVAVARAVSLATELNLGNNQAIANRAFDRVLEHQRRDGGFQYHSRRNYRWLSDRRSYPRYHSMILHHLLAESQSRNQKREDYTFSS